MYNNLPFVSVVMSMFNEEKFISKCLSSLLIQDYPKDNFEVIIVDSGSTDKSVDLVNSFSSRFNNLHLVLLNKKVPITIALNEGIKNSNGEIIARLDCHVEAPPDYLSISASALMNNDAELISGIICPVGENSVSKSIAASLSSDFGIGEAKLYHYNTPVYAKRGYLGVFYKEFVTNLGLYDEKLSGADDFDLFYRIKQINKRILVIPDIKMKYYCRDSFKALSKQYYKYGVTKVVAFKKYRKILSLKSVLPALMLLLVLLFFIISLFWKPVLIVNLLLVSLYFLISSGFAIYNVIKFKNTNFFNNVFTYWILHLSHSLGFLKGFFCNKYE